MGKIDVFDYIERAAAAFDEKLAGYNHAADKLTEYLTTKFSDVDAIVGITSRIKTRDSLKEKILRNNLYRNASPEQVIYDMHDIIGVKIECRFFKDEAFVFGKIREMFCIDADDGMYCTQDKKSVKLKLDTPQPEYQKNGYAIFRIDGNITYANESYNFELQIKSLVNSFWSEIEHKLIYKNNRFNLFDNLIKEMLEYTHESLASIDYQLNLIFDKMSGNTIRSQHDQLKTMLTLGINEIFTAITKARTGIPVAITEYTESIVEYLITASSYKTDAENEPLFNPSLASFADERRERGIDDNYYGGLFIGLMKWMREIDFDTIALGERITLDVCLDGTYGEVAKIFEKDINDDFYLNTFFHIYFSLERGDDSQDFADYIRYYTDTVMANKTQEQMYRTLARLSELPPNKLPLTDTIKMLQDIK